MGKSHIGSGSVTPGAIVAAKTATFDFTDTGLFAPGIELPADSQILAIYIDIGPNAWDSAGDSMEIGTEADPDAYGNVVDIQNEGRNIPLHSSAQVVNMADIGPQDVEVFLQITSGAGLTEGDGRITILYSTTLDNF